MAQRNKGYQSIVVVRIVRSDRPEIWPQLRYWKSIGMMADESESLCVERGSVNRVGTLGKAL